MHVSSLPRSNRWLRRLTLLGPVAACTAAALTLALRALPLSGSPRLVFAAAFALDIGLLALSSWSSVLAVAQRLRADRASGKPYFGNRSKRAGADHRLTDRTIR